MTFESKYEKPLNEAELFEWGAASWTLDKTTRDIVKSLLANVTWHRPDDIPTSIEGYIPEAPLGRADKDTLRMLAGVIARVVNSPSLVPGIAQMGYFNVGGVEIQNGSYDPNWHHDGLAGKRMGHAGDFFAIFYFGTPEWKDAWGGHFEYAKRELSQGWPYSGFSPSSEVRRIAPEDSTALLGWNQNPRLIHRAAPLKAPRDRITLIASLDFQPRG